MSNKAFRMTLPVSMEDTELFPKTSTLSTSQGSSINVDALRQMRSSLSRLWWSRLMISVRGYVINYMQQEEEMMFFCDDAFISIHRFLAEEESDITLAEQFIADLGTIVSYASVRETLIALASGVWRESPNVKNPFSDSETKTQFRRVFGEPSDTTYRIAKGQIYAYSVFMRVLCTLESRWKAEREKKKGIRFETDPEWQPDDRVVFFQEFFQGNRTWVLLDFDRYILSQWRPNGASIIFGDRFVEKKKSAGMQLCTYCGMIEQHPGQFPQHNGSIFCSSECLQAVARPGPTVIQL